MSIGYDDAGRCASVTYPNTNSVTYGYNVASELTSLTYKKGVTVLGDLMYTYEAAQVLNRFRSCNKILDHHAPVSDSTHPAQTIMQDSLESSLAFPVEPRRIRVDVCSAWLIAA